MYLHTCVSLQFGERSVHSGRGRQRRTKHVSFCNELSLRSKRLSRGMTIYCISFETIEGYETYDVGLEMQLSGGGLDKHV